jgi:hypothetical protein
VTAETMGEKLIWVVREEYARQLLLAQTRVARAQAEVDDLKMRQQQFEDRMADEDNA